MWLSLRAENSSALRDDFFPSKPNPTWQALEGAMRSLPVFLDLARGHVLLTGAGAPALAKLATLRARGVNILWYPVSIPHNAALAFELPPGYGAVEIRHGEPDEADLAGILAIIAAAGDEADERLALMAAKCGVPINVVDWPEQSSFIFPAIVDRGDVVVAISTGGVSPVLARRLRERIEAVLPGRVRELAQFLKQLRSLLKERFGRAAVAREFWERVIDGPVARSVLEGRLRERDFTQQAELLLAAIKGPTERTVIPFDGAGLGPVALVGAGPGDPDLLTLKALHALQDADVIFYDELVTPEILERARREATRVFVGKRQGHPGEGQESINRRLIAASRAGRRVVRLKGGDPFIFGRGGEELEALRKAGIPVTIVPGITAALGCAAETELPLTFRGEATGLVFLTAHRANEKDVIGWSRLNDPQTTLVIYMGHTTAAEVRDGLISGGRGLGTPVLVIARGTWASSQAIAGQLKDLPALAARVGQGPALLVIGDVVTHSKPWRQSQVHTESGLLEAV